MTKSYLEYSPVYRSISTDLNEKNWRWRYCCINVLSFVNSIPLYIFKPQNMVLVRDPEHVNCGYPTWFMLSAMAFIISDRTYDWSMRLHALYKMLPLFAASVNGNFARSARFYLQETQDLSDSHPSLYEHFMYGEHIVRHTNNSFSGCLMDLGIETTLRCLLMSLTTSGGSRQDRHWGTAKPIESHASDVNLLWSVSQPLQGSGPVTETDPIQWRETPTAPFCSGTTSLPTLNSGLHDKRRGDIIFSSSSATSSLWSVSNRALRNTLQLRRRRQRVPTSTWSTSFKQVQVLEYHV